MEEKKPDDELMIDRFWRPYYGRVLANGDRRYCNGYDWFVTDGRRIKFQGTYPEPSKPDPTITETDR